ncbi:CGNR zinc finger domain-containing protein [Streptosporangium lutulentum]|uniref:RNA-binding Zn ribbon-like protein n=1 Tax=Streptosporangium lutulentum TaxID=1461250 RepID=A0ABT9Q453_9ACTN|nr:CGNR zinc finger domain-containing protein [Streptosporangium lutulentum]MDP9841516.1 putative RNA-binding Zn ribbon-like protein [Streptosporangium lutulentum]
MLERPHRGEPLPLELVNTRWVSGGKLVDFFEDDLHVGRWLAEHGFADRVPDARVPLLEARDALRDALDRPGDATEARLNAVLAHGSVRTEIHGGRPERTVDADAGWLPAWTAVSRYAELIETQPDRVRQCAHPECVLYFHDTSRNGTRRWHSMETCGARSKSQRHYRRAQSGQSAS